MFDKFCSRHKTFFFVRSKVSIKLLYHFLSFFRTYR